MNPLDSRNPIDPIDSIDPMNPMDSRNPTDSRDPIDPMNLTSATIDARPAVAAPASARSRLPQSTLRPGSTLDTPYTPDKCRCGDQSRYGATGPGPHTRR